MIQADGLPLSEILDCSIISEVFEEEKVHFGIADDDVYTPAITLWAMISQMLHSEAARSCKAAAGRVVTLWAKIANRVVAQNAPNYCRAKAKIPVAALRTMTLRLSQQTESQTIHFDDLGCVLEADQAEDRRSPPVIAAIRSQPIVGRILNVDGFTIDAPDTPENQETYPQNPAQKEGLGFPIIRCVALISMVTGLLVGCAYTRYSGKGTGETALLRQLRKLLRPGDTLVADSYYCTYWIIAMCIAMKVHLVMKNHHKRDDEPLGALRISASDRRVTLLRPARPEWMSKRE